MNQKLSSASKLKLTMPILYALLCLAYFILTGPSTLLARQIIGVAIAMASFGLWILARVQLGNAFSLAPKSKFLVKSGLYGKLRHPVYYFSISAVVGIGLYVGQLWVLLPILLLCVLELIRIRKEESVLTASFGKEYETYKKQTWF